MSSSWAVTAPYGDVTAHDGGFAGIDAARGRLLGVDPVRRRLPDQARAACASVARRSCVSGIHNDEYLGYRRPEGRSGRRRGRPGLGPGSVNRDGALGRESAAQQTELVAFRVGQNMPSFVAALPYVGASSPRG